MPHDKILIRLAGLCALGGAGLRVATAFPSVHVPVLGSEALYLTIDLLLTLGLFGLFAGLSRFRGWLGTLGFVGAVAGFALVRTGERLGERDAYQLASSVLALGLAIAGLALVGCKGIARFAGVAWLASLALGLVGTAVHWGPAFQVASLLFCLGFGLGGLALLLGDDA
jgi:hypothetical protein